MWEDLTHQWINCFCKRRRNSCKWETAKQWEPDVGRPEIWAVIKRSGNQFFNQASVSLHDMIRLNDYRWPQNGAWSGVHLQSFITLSNKWCFFEFLVSPISVPFHVKKKKKVHIGLILLPATDLTPCHNLSRTSKTSVSSLNHLKQPQWFSYNHIRAGCSLW